MINSFVITNYLGESLELEMCRPEKSGFAITSVDGLGPVNANINTTEMSSIDGSIYNSARMNSRNIVFTLRYVDMVNKKSIEELRHILYRYFPTKKKVTVEINTDTRKLVATGYVENNQQVVFDKTAQCSISIKCPDPYLYAKDPIAVVFSGEDAAFEFEFETPDDDQFEFGIIRNDKIQTVLYTGDIEIGITLHIRATEPTGDITISNSATHEFMKVDATKVQRTVGQGIIAGDEIVITTTRGQKHIVLIRQGVSYDILNCLDRKSKWFHLVSGDNIFAYEATYGVDGLMLEIDHSIAYEGV